LFENLGDRASSIINLRVVATKFPNIGNGIDFIDMDPNDRMKLHKYIEASKEDAAGNSAPS
jgi:hypothetical protein